MTWNLIFLAWVAATLSGCFALLEKDSINVLEDSRPEQVSPPTDTQGEKILLRGGAFSLANDGTIFFVDADDKSVVRKTSLTSLQTREEFIDLSEWLKHGEEKFQIDDLWTDSKNRLILAESVTGKILRISPDARKLENLADSYEGYRFSKLVGLTGSPKGEVFVGSPHSATVYRIDPILGKTSVLNEDLVRANDMIIDSSGNRLLVAESHPNRIVVYDLNDSKASITSWTLIRFPEVIDRPLAIDLVEDRPNHLAVLVGGGKKIQVFDLIDGKVTQELFLSRKGRQIRIHDGMAYFQSNRRIHQLMIP